jgi:anti-sigma factor ChrR (cupin superfamily)
VRINADLSLRAVVASEDLPWVASPAAGVERRMLEREGDEVARVTSIVRFAPGSRFSAHEHGGGEEFLVLAGTFSDDEGDFPAGSYVRNPVGTRHAPRTEEGCTLLVKLHWMRPEDQAVVRVDTRRDELWQPGGHPGIEVMDLHSFGDESAALLRLAAGAALPARDLPGGEELFVLEGACADAAGDYPTGTWIRTPPGEAPALLSRTGCRLYAKRGHLADPPPAPG